MKFILVLAPLVTAMTVSAFPAAEASLDNTIPVVSLPPLSGNSTFDLQESTLDSRQNGDTVMCYNTGTKIDRQYAVRAIDTFCQSEAGRTLLNGQTAAVRYTFPDRAGITMLISVTANPGCVRNGMAIGDECPIYLRRPIDQCNTSGENGKQGGIFSTNAPCASYRADPGVPGNDF